ncbi:glycosyl transferase family 1 [Thermocrinis ruber]|uniref:Glycosyl transferase family 1 n=1 Tax=Thermocrinis ruber TaxID=75906 RepID=W0DCG4_9AQUI|nr:glycosyltransferase [Thermocrinis ruber]AHE95986.1 glycosyl transferase family 1 [Thermocrinis ruber]
MAVKLYFLINSLAGGGAEKVAIRLSEHLPISEFILLERDVKYKTDKPIFFLSNHSTKTSPIIKTLNIPIYAYKLSDFIEKNSLVVSFLERANFVNIISKLFKKHKAIISVHVDQQTGHVGLRKLNKLLVRLLYPKADLIIAVSHGVKESLINLGIEEEKIKVIYNPYPIDQIRELAKESLGSYEEIFKHPVLITAGRLTKQKGLWYLLRVFKALKEKHKDLKLVILGEGELKDYLVELSQELGLKTYVWDRDRLSESFDVYFLGFQKNPFKFMARSKLFVFPSLWEGFGNVLVEAMVCGVPVVSSDCRSGPREILAPNTDFNYQTQKPEFAEYGVLIPVFEVKYKTAKEPLEEREIMWVETVDKLLEDENLRKNYSEKVKQRAEDFRIEKIVQEWKEVL